jgi:Fe-S-cluster-containing hydrogenase component 2
MCEVACSAHHFGGVSPALSRIRVSKLDEVGLDLAIACLGCTEKPCLECPTEALSVGSRGEVLLDPDFCDACGTCMDACPIGAVGFHDEQPLFCDLCDGANSCVGVCPTGALSYRPDQAVSLEAFLDSRGSPGQRRAHYLAVKGAPLREEWAAGRRVDS